MPEPAAGNDVNLSSAGQAVEMRVEEDDSTAAKLQGGYLLTVYIILKDNLSLFYYIVGLITLVIVSSVVYFLGLLHVEYKKAATADKKLIIESCAAVTDGNSILHAFCKQNLPAGKTEAANNPPGTVTISP